ncbi:YkuS family protein [Clostridiaceae bacterium M8S5]|nr:YkuS family protein [Clostridiaceae bacterium M8S5]
MHKKILVEDSLTDVSKYLNGKGFDVSTIENSDINSCDAIVVTGGDSNIMGISNTETDKPIINARGKTSEEIYNQIKETLS